MTRLPHQSARHGTVDHGDAFNGVFLLLHLWVLPSSRAIFLANNLPPLLSSLWMASRVNGSLYCEMAAPPAIQDWRIFGCKKGGWTDPGVGQAGWLGPTGPGSSRPDSVTPSLQWVLMYLCILRLHLHHFDDVILASKWRTSLHEVWSFTLQSLGMFLCNASVVATFGSDFIKFLNTNETLKLLFWTYCDSILYVHIFLQ
jgi:hypothetical protein